MKTKGKKKKMKPMSTKHLNLDKQRIKPKGKSK